MPPATPRRLSISGAVLVALGLVWWAADDLRAWLAPHVARIFQTSGIPAEAVRCTLPTEHEQMVVVLWWREGKLRHRCMFVGTRGTYGKPAAKGQTL